MDQHDQEEQEDAQSELERLFRAGKLSHQDMISPQEQQVRLQQNLRDLQQGKLSRGEVSARIEGLAKAHFTEAIPTIEQFLTSEDSLLRDIALKSLTRYFGLEKHWETAHRFLLEDDICRDAGISALADLKQATSDARTLALLAAVVCDSTEWSSTRKRAYAAMIAVLRGYLLLEQFAIQNERFVLERHADWSMVHTYLNAEGELYLKQRAASMATEVQETQAALQRSLEKMGQRELHDPQLLRTITYLGQERFFSAIPALEHLLSSENGTVRATALKSLTLYFGLEKYWETARRFLLEDPDEDCRQAGAEALSYLQQDTGDTRTMTLLASVVCNKDETQAVRKMAYAAFLAVRHYDGRDWYTILNEKYDLESEAGWEIVNSYT
ncbi:MAG: HEAT repeat domain-containing protein [Chloroflexota bacterium]|nr:HEAT repeat domain-containing protein [Chloroflexota bacterium]